MLKAFGIVAFLSAAIFAASLIALMIGYSWQPADQETSQQHSEENKAEQNYRESEKPFWQKATSDPVAAFTLWLVIFTAVLGAASIFQLASLNRSEGISAKAAKAAEDAAKAAKQSADAVANVERPYFFVTARPDPIVQKDAADQPAPKIVYSITNMGRVPAVIRLLLTDCNLTDSLPQKQTVDASKFRPGIVSIGAGSTLEVRERCQFEKTFTSADWADLRFGKKMAVFEAIFTYEGALDFTYVTSLAYRIDLFTGDAFPIGGSAYNYDDSTPGRFSKTDKMIFSKLTFFKANEPSPPPPNQ